MKTLTEFDGFSLKNALTKKQELVAGGKTPEELPQALGEALKIEGDRLTYMIAALEVTEGKADGLKRVVVYNIEEGKSAPKGAVQKGDKWFLAEHFFTAAPKRGREDRDDRGGRGGGRGGRGDKKGGGRGKGGRDAGGGGGRGGRPPRGERPDAQAGGAPGPAGAPHVNVGGPGGGGGGGQRPRRDNRPQQKPSGGKPTVIPRTGATAAPVKAAESPTDEQAAKPSSDNS